MKTNESSQSKLIRRKRCKVAYKMTSIAGCLKQKIYGKVYSSWEQRYCVLDKDIDENKLWIYKSQHDHAIKAKPIEVIFIRNIEPRSIQAQKANDKQFSFWIQNDKRSQYFVFEALSCAQCTIWCEKLIQNQQSKKRKSIRSMRKIAVLKKRSAEVTISALSADSDLYCGWCESELSRKKYQKRFFVLTSIDLRYWKDENEYSSNKPPKVCIPLHLISDLRHINAKTLQIYVQFQDEDDGEHKLRLFEFYSKDEGNITNFASGLSTSNWRRQELRGREDLEASIIRRLESPKIFSSPKKSKEYKEKQPSKDLLLQQRTAYFRVNAPLIDEVIDDGIEEEVDGTEENEDEEEEFDVELEISEECDPYRNLRHLWGTDVAEKRKSILKSPIDGVESPIMIRKKVEFISNTKHQYAESLKSDNSLSEDSSERMDRHVRESLCEIFCSCLRRCCRN